MADERMDVAWLEKLISAHDARYKSIFEAQERALRVAEDNNKHWKAEADDWRRRADEREREFTPKLLFYVMWAASFGVSIVSVVIALYVALK